MTYAHLNTQENMNAYLNTAFAYDTFVQEYKHPHSEFYITTKNEKLVGYYKLNFPDAQSESGFPNSAEVARIYVHPQFKGRGIGRKMINHAAEVSQQKKLEYLWLGVWEKNPAARSFYEKIGFKAIGDHIFHLGDDAQRDIIMKKYICPTRECYSAD